ncbi:MAG TPA: hypothetical protein PLU10_01575 [Chitinophagaceae bacterium]|mgnify:CR=1 FL=1|nr:hypothetical protein [Chitinophagaceae bacterium]
MAKTEKRTISEPQLKLELIKCFEKGNTDKGNLWELFGTKYKIQKQRFYKNVNSVLLGWQEITDKVTTEQVQANQSEALKSGLKSKFQWVSELQKELDENRVEESVLDLKTGKVIRFFRTMTPTERKGHMERISKFMGMDAPIKSADTNPDGSVKESPLEMLIKKGGSVTIGTKK